MEKRLCALLFSIVLLTTVSAQDVQEAVFEMDGAGNAQMTFKESLDWEVQELNVMASVDASGAITVSGTITEAESILDPDYKIIINAQGSTADLSFEASGDIISELLGISGDFDLDIAMEEVGGELKLEIEATVQRDTLEEILFLDVSSLQENMEATRLLIQSQLNDAFSLMPLDTKPRIDIEEFSIVGESTLSITLEMSVGGWSDFVASAMALSYQEGGEDLDLLTCLGLSVEELVSALLGSNTRSTMSVSGSGDSMSGTVNAVSMGTEVEGGPSIESINLEVSKTGRSTRIQGSAIVGDVQTLMGCMVQEYMPGDYIVEGLDYKLVKGSGGMVLQSLEGRVTRLAEKSGDDWEVSFPEDMAWDFDIVVNIPSGMEIKSVIGGNKTGSRSAQSEIGEAFTVVYGKAETGIIEGLDTNMIIVIVIIVLVLLLLATRRKR